MSVNLKNSVIAHYKMNDKLADNVVVDETGNHNGVLKDPGGVPLTVAHSVAGKINYALDFDGNDDCIDVGNTGESVKSVAMWINPDAVDVTDHVISLEPLVYLRIINGTLTIGSALPPTQTLYVDGVVGTAVTADWHFIVWTSTIGFTASDLDIGRLVGSGYFDGLIDNVILFNKILNKQEWAWLYNRGHGTEKLMPNWMKFWNWGGFN